MWIEVNGYDHLKKIILYLVPKAYPVAIATAVLYIHLVL